MPAIDKVIKWKQKLLDLGKRNRLLNFKETKRSTVNIIKPSISEIFDLIANQNKEIEFALRDPDMNALNYDIKDSTSEIKDVQLIDGQVFSSKSDKELLKSLHQLKQKARTAMQEQGVNILYLAFGFLEWTEVPYSNVILKSPIVLVPVSLRLESILEPYKIEMIDEDIVINPILHHKLENDFGLSLKDTPDEDYWNIVNYLSYLRELVSSRGWNIVDEVQLSLFSFLKLNMYKDIERHAEKMAEHSIIKAISGDDSDIAVVPDYIIYGKDFDDKIRPVDTFQVIDADSSQQQAILAAKKGISFILQGPPGTGKSQTITNIIAECLASDKKVLFVSEKMAALEVVYRRLAEVGLTDFCLQLHSHKASKKDVISELGKTLCLSKTKLSDNILDHFEQLSESKIKLNDYVKTIHKKCDPLGKSIYQVHGRLAKFMIAPELTFSIEKAGEKSSFDFSNYEKIVEQFALAVKKMDDEYDENPWKDCNVKMLLFENRNEIEKRFKTLYALLIDMLKLSTTISNTVYLKESSTLESFQNLQKILGVAEHSNQPLEKWFYLENIDAAINEATDYQKIIENYFIKKKYIDDKYYPDIYKMDFDTIFTKTNSSINIILIKLNNNFAENIDDLLRKRPELVEFVKKLIFVVDGIKENCDAITVAIGIESIAQLNDAYKIKKLGEILSINPMPTEIWFNKTSFEDVQNYAVKAEIIYEKLAKIEQGLFEEFNDNIININVDGLLDTLSFRYDKYINIPQLEQQFEKIEYRIYSIIDKILENRKDINHLLPKAIEFGEKFNLICAEISNLTGIEMPISSVEAKYALEICNLMSNNPKPTKDWFNNANIIKVNSYVRECEQAYSILENAKQSIFEQFDKDVVDINYNELLIKFKTEYISPLRFIKPSYYNDVKKIRAYAKNPHLKLSSSKIIELLYNVKDYVECEKWLNGNQSKMESSFGVWFNAEFTKWDEVKEAINTIQSINGYFKGNAPLLLRDLLIESGDAFQKLCRNIYQLNELMQETEFLYFCLKHMNLKEDTDNNRVAINDICIWAKETLGLTKNLFEGIDSVSNLKKHSKKQLNCYDVVTYLTQVKSYNMLKTWIKENEKMLINCFGSWYKEHSTQWKELQSAIEAFDNLFSYFGIKNSMPEKLKNILIKSDMDLLNIIKAYEGLTVLLNQWDLLSQDYKTIIKSKCDFVYITLSELLTEAREIENLSALIFSSYDTIISKLIKESQPLYDEIYSDLKLIIDVNSVYQEIDLRVPELTERYEAYFDYIDTRWCVIVESLKWVKKMKEILAEDNFSEQFIYMLCTSKETLRNIKNWNLEIEQSLIKIQFEIEFVKSLFDVDKFDYYRDDILKVSGWLFECVSNFRRLENWIDFGAIKELCVENGLGNFVDEIIEKGIKSNDIIGAFFKRFYKLWLDHMYLRYSAMTSFRGLMHEDIIKIFRVLDKEQFKIAQSRIRELLSAKRPNPNAVTSRGSEVSILQNEMGKKRRILPLRKLFAKISNLLFTLKPCLLMSPLSVSLFLDPDYFKFDLIVFDEASQICTEDAIGAIFRAEQCVIVGDKEQLPPTNFFNTSTGDTDYDTDNDDEDDDFGAYESILDECGTALNKLSLQWHYRSRHEHLITFSNAKIYRNLITFPSAVDKKDDFGVEYIEVKGGIYDRSGTRANRSEAQKVAQLVFEHFIKYPNRSLGVVAFSEAQQNAIDAEFRKLRLDNPINYDSCFSEDNNENFFIKNLENVQGDERDTIIFSIGYAKDKNGVMHMNFGPLSKQGGYRRLNVAITRAKYNIKLVGSIKPTDIDIDKTSAQGVKMLRQYMEFAINGAEALENEISVPEFIEFDSPFEEEVYIMLCDNGYKVDTQVGCSGYRIDMAIRHPEISSVYTIGIECDGATYHSAKTARERDRLREEVLRLRGWNIYRIWSTDWVKNPQGELERLVKAIEESIISTTARHGMSEDVICNTEASIGLNEHFVEIKQNECLSIETVISQKDTLDNSNLFDDYKVADIYSIEKDYTRGDLQYAADVLIHIVTVESPIHFDLLSRRIAPLFGKERAGSQIKRYINHVLHKCCENKIIKKGDFCWLVDMERSKVRKPAGGDTPRPIEHICSEEIGEAMLAIVGQSIGIDKNMLYIETARAFGFSRTGAKIQDAMAVSLNNLVDKNEVAVNNDVASLTN